MGLTTEFAIEVINISANGPRKRGAALDEPDDIMKQLIEKGLVHDYGRAGEAYIDCIQKDLHSTDSGVTECAYFPPNSAYARGHFKCLHAGCSSLTDADFTEALKLYAAADEEFEDETAQALTALPASLGTTGGVPEVIRPCSYDELRLRKWFSAQKSHPKNGWWEASLDNIVKVLSEPGACRRHLRYDIFRDEIMWTPVGEPLGWRAFRDVDYTDLRIELENNKMLTISKEMMRDCVALAADRHHFDSAILWLRSLTWDGVARVGNFMARYCGSEDNEYTRAVSVYTWSAMAGRCLAPGIQCDMVPIWIGMKQGEGKSSALRAMVPSPDHFVEVSLEDRDDNLARNTKGVLLAEIGELRGFGVREIEAIKSYIARPTDKWVPKYKEMAITYRRRCLFIGTTNWMEILTDTTGNRRWLPVLTPAVDREAIRRDMEQLWAEGMWLFDQFGICWQDAQRLGEGVHEHHMVVDPWHEMLEVWYVTEPDPGSPPPAEREVLLLSELAEGIHREYSTIRPGHERNRLVAFMRKKKRISAVGRINGTPTRGWWKKNR